jgi:TonB family protein
MRRNAMVAFQTAALLFCAGTVVTVQAQTLPPTASSIAPLKFGGNVSAPRPIYAPNPEYSGEARVANHKGTCVLLLTVDVDGKPSNITVLHRAGMGLDEKTIEAVRTWTFEPARKEGKPVPVQIQVSMNFKIGNLGRVKLKHASKVRAEIKKREQALVYRIPDNGAPKICLVSSSDEKQHSDSGLIHVDAGSKYRLDRIAFLNNNAIIDQELLRSQFPIKDGDTYDSVLIEKGLSNLRRAYASIGYINFTAVPRASINDVAHTISLDISSNEGIPFFVSRIDIIGLDEPAFQKVKKELLLEPGEPYNQRLVDFFIQYHSKKSSKDAAIEPNFSLQRNDQQSTVAITYDFRQCSAK